MGKQFWKLDTCGCQSFAVPVNHHINLIFFINIKFQLAQIRTQIAICIQYRIDCPTPMASVSSVLYCFELYLILQEFDMENKAIENFQQNKQNCTDQLHSKVGNSTILYSQRQKTFLVPPSQQKEGQVVISYNFDKTAENSGCTHNILIGWDSQPIKMITKKTGKSNQSKTPFRKKVIEVNKILQENEDLLNDNQRVPLSKLNPNKTMSKFRQGYSEPKDKILPNSISGHVPVSRSLYKNKISTSSTKISKYENEHNKRQNYPHIKGNLPKHQFNGDKLFKIPHENKLTAERKQFRNGKTIETSNYVSPSSKLASSKPNKIFNRCPEINLNHRDVEGPSLFPSDQEEINDNQKHGIETLKLIEELEKLSDEQQINQNDSNPRNNLNTSALKQSRDNPTRQITRNRKFQTSYETDSNKTCQLKESNCQTNKLSHLSEIIEEENRYFARKKNHLQGKSADHRKNKLFSSKEQPLTKADDRSNSSFQAPSHLEKKKVIKRLQETKKVAIPNKVVDPQRKVKIKSSSKEQKQCSNLNKKGEKSQGKIAHKTEESHHKLNQISKISEENSSVYDMANNRNSSNKNEEEPITISRKRNEEKRKSQTSRPQQSKNFRKPYSKNQQKTVSDKNSKVNTKGNKDLKKKDSQKQDTEKNIDNQLSQQEQFNTFKPELYKEQSKNKKSGSSLLSHKDCNQENKPEIQARTQKDGKNGKIKDKLSQKKVDKNSKERLITNKSKATSPTNKQTDTPTNKQTDTPTNKQTVNKLSHGSHGADQKTTKDRKEINSKRHSKQKSEGKQQKKVNTQQIDKQIGHDQMSYQYKEDKMREIPQKKTENLTRNRNKSNGISNTVDKISKQQLCIQESSLKNRSQEQEHREKLQKAETEQYSSYQHETNPPENNKKIEQKPNRQQEHGSQERQKLQKGKNRRQQHYQHQINPAINKKINGDKMEVLKNRQCDRHDDIQFDKLNSSNHNKQKLKKQQMHKNTNNNKLEKMDNKQQKTSKQECSGIKSQNQKHQNKQKQQRQYKKQEQSSFERNQIQPIIKQKGDGLQIGKANKNNQSAIVNKDISNQCVENHSIGNKGIQELAQSHKQQLGHKNLSEQTNNKKTDQKTQSAESKQRQDEKNKLGQDLTVNQKSEQALQRQQIISDKKNFDPNIPKQEKKEQLKNKIKHLATTIPEEGKQEQFDPSKSICKEDQTQNQNLPSRQSKKNSTINQQPQRNSSKQTQRSNKYQKQKSIPPTQIKDDQNNDLANKQPPHKPNTDSASNIEKNGAVPLRNKISSNKSSRNRKNSQKDLNPLSQKTNPPSNKERQPETKKVLKKSNKSESQTKIRNSEKSGQGQKIGSLNNCNAKDSKNQNIRISISSGRNTGRSSKTPTVITCKVKEQFQDQMLDKINPIQSSSQSQNSEELNRDQQLQQVHPKQNTKEQRKKEEVMKNLMKPINAEEKKGRNRDQDDSVHSEWANLSCEANLYPIKEESVFDAIQQRKLNHTDMIGLSPNHKQRKLNNNNVLWGLNEEPRNRQCYERAPILSLIYGNALKKINQLKLAGNSYSYVPSQELSDLQQISQNQSGISDIWDQWWSQQKGYDIDCFQRAVGIIMQVDSWLIDRIIEPYISKKGKNQGWLYCQGYWRPFIDHQKCNILKFLKNILENAAQTFYGIKDGNINQLGIQQIIRMVTGLRVMQLHNKKKSLQQIQFNLKKGHIIKGITKEIRKPYIYRILDIKKTVEKQTNKQIKLIQVQKHNLFSEDRKPDISSHQINKAQTIHSNIHSYIAEHSNENVNWVRQQSLGKYFQYFLMINYRSDSFWTTQALKKQPHNVSVYTLDSLRETAGSLEIHACENAAAKIQFYREVKPRVLKLVGKINEKNKNRGIRSVNSPNPSLYFDFKIKGKYYVFIEYDKDGSQQSSTDVDIAFESSEPLVINFLQKIKKSSLKNSHSEYVSVQAKEPNKFKGLSISSSLSIKQEFIKYLMGTQKK